MLCLKDGTNSILREHHANLEHRDGKTRITKRAHKFICNDIAMIDLDLLSYTTTHSMTDNDNQLQLLLVPVSLQMFLRPIANTDKRVAVWRQNVFKAVSLCQEYCHTKWACHCNLIIDLGQNGCSYSYTGLDTLNLTRRHKTTNTASLIAGLEMMPQILLALDTLWK